MYHFLSLFFFLSRGQLLDWLTQNRIGTLESWWNRIMTKLNRPTPSSFACPKLCFLFFCMQILAGTGCGKFSQRGHLLRRSNVSPEEGIIRGKTTTTVLISPHAQRHSQLYRSVLQFDVEWVATQLLPHSSAAHPLLHHRQWLHISRCPTELLWFAWRTYEIQHWCLQKIQQIC